MCGAIRAVFGGSVLYALAVTAVMLAAVWYVARTPLPGLPEQMNASECAEAREAVRYFQRRAAMVLAERGCPVRLDEVLQ